MPNHTRDIYQIFVPMHCMGRIAVSSMNFATKDRLGLNLLIYRKEDRIQFPNIKRHNFD